MTADRTRIFINGFGRIGRTLLRILSDGQHRDIEIVGINDIEPLETCAYLFEYDSVYGAYRGTVEVHDSALVVDGQPISFHAQSDLSTLDLSSVDVVLECTGMAGTRAIAERGLAAGAQAVLISGPSDEADVTVVLGANDADLQDQVIVSNASCTTNALAPLMRVLDAEYGLISGHMTTVHCYTGSQPTVDKPRGDLARSRAAALSMVPTTTSAQRMIDRVLPHLKGRVEARAIRVPTASVSAIDLTIQTERAVTAGAVNALLRQEAEKNGILGWTRTPLVSTDLRARPESLIVSERETSVSVGGLLRVFGWYDNEWGFSNRMLEMAGLMGRRSAARGDLGDKK
ncbi:type I glyceraldehyde-3-phosphate dehydrogenase [Shimia sp. MMG029]|uniref:type I glyceraldehyde-3-phosphate dehydrogenase n=1 Tax=Shimia sp. MMG029 TaxID=3021978 RepID=UPI0022FE262A|nr:glyceraldehyde 3-phosphate dehydrogenase NAD-binding domain-containing protein [Shimia sp. MMG029]MDA5555169.1 glyceraldehyde 3-phosphate dehydrogenase NAD-binding domain-containing protein [Shimia sp. MMG029]